MINGITFAHRNAFQCRAIEERTTDACDTIGNGNRGQAFATGERIVADARDTVRDRNRCQAGTFEERIVADARHAVSYHNRGDRVTVRIPWRTVI